MQLRLGSVLVSVVRVLPKLEHNRSLSHYLTYDQALNDCTGYEQPTLLDVIAKKTERLRDSAPNRVIRASDTDVYLFGAVLAVRNLIRRPEVSVLDFGGSCGAHYFSVRRVLPAVPVRWVIVETSGMAERARRVSQGAFHAVDSIERALDICGQPDLVFSSGALQYTPNPWAMLRQLLELAAPVF